MTLSRNATSQWQIYQRWFAETTGFSWKKTIYLKGRWKRRENKMQERSAHQRGFRHIVSQRILQRRRNRYCRVYLLRRPRNDIQSYRYVISDRESDYLVPLVGEISLISYKLLANEIDFSEVSYWNNATDRFYIENVGKVPFEFNINLSTLLRSGMLEVSPINIKKIMS